MKTIHIEGMGAMGALTAFQLAARGIPFTWHDKEPLEVEQTISPKDFHTAWHASTGAVFPTGEEDDMSCFRMYQLGLLDAYPVGVFTLNDWVYGAKKPPHNAKIIPEREVGGLKVVENACLNCDVQTLVLKAREQFAYCRLPSGPDPRSVGFYFVAHGWSERQTHVYWGWTRRVKLELDIALEQDSSFYFRKDRFFIRYAYKIGAQPWWYAGSTITKQKQAKHSPGRMEKEYARWKKDFEALCGGLVRVSEEGEYIEGWRPASGSMHDRSEAQYELTLGALGEYFYPPRSHDGIRRFPDIWAEVAQVLAIPVLPDDIA